MNLQNQVDKPFHEIANSPVYVSPEDSDVVEKTIHVALPDAGHSEQNGDD